MLLMIVMTSSFLMHKVVTYICKIASVQLVYEKLWIINTLLLISNRVQSTSGM